jgi:CDP-6-deoxy-D-xylo-4-hexulose-3-dehydrase
METLSAIEQMAQVAGFVFEQMNRPQAFIAGFTPVPASGKVIDRRDIANAVEAVMDGWLTEGRWTAEFERRFAKMLGVRGAAFCNSGSSANMLAVCSLTSPKLGMSRLVPGDRVATLAAGFPTTVSPIIWNRLIPVFLDINLETYVPNLDSIKAAVVDWRAKAIVMAHTLGNPWPVDEMAEFPAPFWIIEDNCDALGSTFWRGPVHRMTGTFGVLSTYSFYPAHQMTTGEGGMVAGESGLIKIVKSFRDWGRDCWCGPGQENTCGKRFGWDAGALPFGYDHKYIYSHLGFNMKSTDIQAAIGLSQLERLPEFVAARRRNWRRLRAGLNDLEEFFYLPRPAPGTNPSWFGFPLTVRATAPFGLGQIEQFFAERKIGTRRIFAGNILRQPAFRTAFSVQSSTPQMELTNTDLVAENGFWVGVWPGLTEPMLDFVIESFHEFVRSRK